jgi:WD40 repeat protein
MRRQHERETERRLRLAWSTRIGLPKAHAAASDPESRGTAAIALPYESISAPRLALTVCTIPNADPAYYAGIGAVAAIEHEGEPLILSAGSAGLRSWRLDGAPGELAQPGHHHAVALAWHDGEPLVIAALGATPGEPTLCGWRLDGTAATGTADGTITTARDIGKLAALALDGEPLVVTASGSTIRSWRLDGSPGGLPVLQSPSKFVTGLSMTSHDGRPLVVCGGDDGAIRSWYVDGAPGPLHGEHGAWIQALVTLEHEGSPLVVAGGIGGALRSWRVDGAPGPLALQLDVRGIRALAVGTVGGDPIVITAGGDGHLLSWYPDGSPGPFAHIDHHEGTAETLAVYDDPENPLLISVDHDASISAWRLSGAPATREREDARAYQLETSVALRPELSPELASHIAWRLGRARRADIAPDAAHGYRLMAIAVTEHDGRPLVVSAGSDDVGSHVTIGSWRLDGSPGPLDRVFRPSWMQDCRRIAELSIVEHDGEPLVIGCGDAGLQSWRLDGRPGPLSRRGVHPELNSYTKQYDDSIAALAVVREGGAPLVVTGGSDAAIRSWRLDGTPGPLERLHADTHWIGSLAVVWHASLPLIVSGGNDGTLCSWILDGCAGPFVRERAHDGAIRHLAVAEHERQPLVISSSDDAPIRSWRLDGRSGPLTVEQRVSAIAVLEHPVDPWLITGGHDGAIRSWRLDGTPAPFTSEGAHVGGVTKLLVVRHDGRLLVISAGHDLAIVAHRLDAR